MGETQLVIDVSGDVLSCKYVATDGTIPDQFTITKTGARLSETEDESVLGLNVFPNPISDEFIVFYELLKEGNVSTKLIDITGRIIEGSAHSVFQTTGGYQFHFNKNELHLTSGIYFLSISVNEKQYVQKVFVD